jgi:hypothetical protein
LYKAITTVWFLPLSVLLIISSAEESYQQYLVYSHGILFKPVWCYRGVSVCYIINNVCVYKNIPFPLPTANLLQNPTKIFLPTCMVATAVTAL